MCGAACRRSQEAEGVGNPGAVCKHNMADAAARRREQRRRRILDNAEERKRKIFGTTKAPSDEGEQEGECLHPVLPRLPVLVSLPLASSASWLYFSLCFTSSYFFSSSISRVPAPSHPLHSPSVTPCGVGSARVTVLVVLLHLPLLSLS